MHFSVFYFQVHVFTVHQSGSNFTATTADPPPCGLWAFCCTTWSVGTSHSSRTKRSYVDRCCSGGESPQVRPADHMTPPSRSFMGLLPCRNHTSCSFYRVSAAYQVLLGPPPRRTPVFRGHHQPPLDAELGAPYRQHRDQASQHQPRASACCVPSSHCVQMTLSECIRRDFPLQQQTPRGTCGLSSANKKHVILLFWALLLGGSSRLGQKKGEIHFLVRSVISRLLLPAGSGSQKSGSQEPNDCQHCCRTRVDRGALRSQCREELGDTRSGGEKSCCDDG